MRLLTPDRVSVQLYSLRHRIVREGLGPVLADLAGIGVRHVEPFGLPDGAEALARSLADHGLDAPTVHAAVTGPGGTVAALEAAAWIGAGMVVVPATDPNRWTRREDVLAVADELSVAVGVAQEAGVRLGYHNHWWEVATAFGSDAEHSTGLDVLAEHADPRLVLEVDVYWVVAGGADPLALLGRVGERVVALHLKDSPAAAARERDVRAQVPAGQGELPLAGSIAGCPALELGVLELDDSDVDLTEAVAAGFAWLTA